MTSRWSAQLVCLLAVTLVTVSVGADTVKRGTGPLRHATFELRNAVKVRFPEGAQHVRMWIALPQDNDPAQQVRDLKIDAPYPYRIERDSEGSRVLYLEAQSPKEKELTVVETFVVTRQEIRDHVDPSKARPLNSEFSRLHATDLFPNASFGMDPEFSYKEIPDPQEC